MNVNLTRRLSALESKITPTGKPIVIWGMAPNGEPMTDREIEQEFRARRNAGAPSNVEFISIMWQAV